MRIPPSTTAAMVGMMTSKNRRDRTRQFFSARRDEAREAVPPPSRCCPPGDWPNTSGGDPFRAAPDSTAAPGWVSAGSRSVAAEGMRRFFLVLDSTALAPLTMERAGVERHAGAATE